MKKTMSFSQDISEADIKPGQVNFFRLALPFHLPVRGMPSTYEAPKTEPPLYAEQANAIEALNYEIISILQQGDGFHDVRVFARKKHVGD